MTPKVQLAKEIAQQWHKGQVDKNGEDYINHLRRVANRGKTEEEQIVGWLHDLLEDTTFEAQMDNLTKLREDFGREPAEAIIKMTKKDTSFSYYQYIHFVGMNNLATRVKKNDLLDNMNLMRFLRNGNVPKWKDIKRVFKYMRAYLILSL